MVEDSRRFRKDDLTYGAIMLLYLGIVVFLTAKHENWRDEAQAWLLARDLNVIELFRQMSYEGHPCLWHLILMPFAKLGFPYRTMNVVSMLLVASAAGLMLWKSPVSLGWKIPVLFGGAFLYFMPVVSRSYSLIPLFICINAAIYKKRHQSPVWYGLSLALLVQTHIYILPFAGWLSVFWLFEAIDIYRKSRNRRFLIQQGLGLLLPCFSFLLFLVQMSGVQKSSAFLIHWKDSFSYDTVFNQLNISLFGFRGLYINRMFPRILYTRPKRSFILILFFLCAPVLVFFLAIKRRQKEVAKAAGIYLMATLSGLFLMLLLGRTGLQKTAIFAFLPIWLLWTSWRYLQVDKQMLRLTLVNYVGLALLFLMMNSAAIYDVHNCYSDAADCAAFIRENLPSDATIFQNSTAYASSVVAYLNADGLYSLESGESESFAQWINREPRITDYKSFCESVERIRAGTETAYLLIQMKFVEPYIDILTHTDSEDILYSSFLEKDPAPEECYILMRISINEE